MEAVHLGYNLPRIRLGTRSIRCPSCHQRGSFESPHQDLQDFGDADTDTWFGSRVCPNTECRAHVFFIGRTRNNVRAADLEVYPPEGIDFDDTDIPADIAATFSEALLCQRVGAHTAAAIMIRRTLEELCADKEIEDGSLRDRIKALELVVTVPKALLDGADVLRLLGNDAAHLERQVFSEIGHDQLETAIEFTKELLKAVYQYGTLLRKLEALKGTAEASTE